MSRTSVALSALVFAALGAYGGALAYASAHDRIADEIVRATQSAALKQRSELGALPARLTITSPRVFWVLPGPAVHYSASAGDCHVFYSQWPAGPKRGLSCSSGEWQYE